MKYKALIFDMDGTLLDTMSGVIEACNESFKDFGYDVRFTNNDGKYFIGAGAAEFARRALAHANIDKINLINFRDAFYKNYAVYQKTGTKPFKGLQELLVELKNHGYIIGVCSNKPQHLLDEVTKQMYPDFKFDIVVGQRQGIPCKPEPNMFEIVLNELNIKRDDALYIGDSEYDYKFAENSKVDCCIVTYGYGIYEDPFMSKTKYSAKDVNELKKLLLN